LRLDSRATFRVCVIPQGHPHLLDAPVRRFFLYFTLSPFSANLPLKPSCAPPLAPKSLESPGPFFLQPRGDVPPLSCSGTLHFPLTPCFSKIPFLGSFLCHEEYFPTLPQASSCPWSLSQNFFFFLYLPTCVAAVISGDPGSQTLFCFSVLSWIGSPVPRWRTSLPKVVFTYQHTDTSPLSPLGKPLVILFQAVTFTFLALLYLFRLKSCPLTLRL